MRSLPGLAFADRSALFDELMTIDTDADVVSFSLGGRTTWLLSEASLGRATLSSEHVRKGRSPSSARGVGGYVSLGGDRFASARADVIAALRRAARDEAGLVAAQARPGTCLALVAHLAGDVPEGAFAESLAVLLRELTTRPDAETDQRRRVVGQLTTALSSESSFVRELVARGWALTAIASEIIALSFAGWPSLAAAVRSAGTLGVTGSSVTDDTVSELLRVAPPAWLIVRECLRPLQLTGVSVPAGGLVMISPWLLHRDDRAWPDSAAFVPARPGLRGSPWYLPFGLGRRNCPAELYSRAFLHAALSLSAGRPPARHVRPGLLGGRSACLLPA
ncbi:cytochrome P450 [Lentzea aerocolonigenes]|uniref:cytochrome P450 n=1 Tax=Lentzea aerocolonigenes TaxID=68170 RepID=UPI0004C3F915|nr:cytochrome P450 [Lentzea aerocolonigenes]MCP2243362.1 Cytochrome P450 [Lentzea aerocolonigenes]